MSLDWTKPIQTRDGRPARLLAQNIIGRCPLAVAVCYTGTRNEDVEIIYTYPLTGIMHSSPSMLDIINVQPAKRTVWINIYPTAGSVGGHPSREEADYHATYSRVACVEVEYVDGQGL